MKPGVFSQMYIQLVFAVRNREALLRKDIRNEVFAYMSGIVTNLKHKSIIINGTHDHVHVFLGLNLSVSISNSVYELKRSTSLFINNENWFKAKFYWQEGYGAFTYSHYQVDNVYKYILNQEKHHSKVSFRYEYIDLLEMFQIKYDEKFLFKPL